MRYLPANSSPGFNTMALWDAPPSAIGRVRAAEKSSFGFSPGLVPSASPVIVSTSA
jgi:hypothetical protein